VSVLRAAARAGGPPLPAAQRDRIPALSASPGAGRRDAWRWPSDAPLTTAQALRALEEGELQVVGRLADASNASLYCELRVPWQLPGGQPLVHVMYKPVQGERPLEDFPDATLARRETAAWLVSEGLGWRIVPPTVLRDGPFGEGMVQLWIDVDPRADILELILARDERLRRMAVFDVLANNADRKGSHILPTEDGDILGCDHGICFATEPKLRTVLWGWRDEPLLPEEHDAIAGLRRSIDGELGTWLAALLADEEISSLASRAEGLLAHARLPLPHPYQRNIPWPPF
jgi:hypothetical protein